MCVDCVKFITTEECIHNHDLRHFGTGQNRRRKKNELTNSDVGIRR